MPVSVFTVGCVFGMETYTPKTLINMIVVTIGVIIASYGEINFVVIGVVLQLLSVASESTRLMLIQILLQKRGLSLNPVTTMYYIAPASFLFLSVPFAVVSSSKEYISQLHESLWLTFGNLKYLLDTEEGKTEGI